VETKNIGVLFFKKMQGEMNTARLMEYIRESEMTEEMKRALIPIAQVANESDKQRIFFEVSRYNQKKFEVRQKRNFLLQQRESLLRG
jgi:hypothetical protein